MIQLKTDDVVLEVFEDGSTYLSSGNGVNIIWSDGLTPEEVKPCLTLLHNLGMELRTCAERLTRTSPANK